MNKSKSKNEWLKKAAAAKTTGMKFTSLSGKELDIAYTPEDVSKNEYDTIKIRIIKVWG